MNPRVAAGYALMLLLVAAVFAAVANLGTGLVAPSPAAGQPLFERGGGGAEVSHPLAHVLLAVAVILVASRTVGALFRRLGQPPVIGEMLAGILLGPSLLGSVFPAASAFLLPPAVAPQLGILAQIGVVLFLFLVGLELDTAIVRERSRTAVAVAHASISVPFLLGSLSALLLYPATATSDVPFVPFALFVAVAMSVTAFPVLARILGDTGLQKTPLGGIALAAAAADDVTAWCLLAFVLGVAKATAGAAVLTVVLAVAFTATMLLVVRPAVVRWVQRQTGPASSSSRAMAVLFLGLLLTSLATEAIGIHALFGAFLFGAIVPHDSALAKVATQKLTDVVVVLFLPLFFAYTGLRTQIGLVEGAGNWLLCGLVVAIATAGKFGGAYVAARANGLPRREAGALGALMNTRGMMELVVLNVGLDLRLISPLLFAMMVTMALVTTLLTTPLLHLLGVTRTAAAAADADAVHPPTDATPGGPAAAAPAAAPAQPRARPPDNPMTPPISTVAATADPTATTWDVLICGGGFAGILLARQLRLERPELSVAVVEKTTRPLPDAAHKVGESSVELGCQYFLRLGLREYMRERQLPKMGLRFFPGGGHLPLHQRTEIGPCAEPILPSYQIDRGRIETDLRDQLQQAGVTLLEGAKITQVELGTEGALHHVTYDDATGSHRLSARWVVDATGRNALVRRQRELTRPSRHTASSGWYRIKGRFDINQLVPKTETEWYARPLADKRWLSTNHFMGDGYWVWVIPLATGNTSIGVVIHEDTHDYRCIAGLEATQAFIRKHEPQLAAALEGWEVVDFLCIRNYSYTTAQAWSEDRWALVGIAGAFVDPLFSPGNDCIALANCFTMEMLRADAAGEDLKAKAAILNTQYRGMLVGCFELFRRASPVFGHASAMATKVFWNNFSYWSFTCQYYQQELCRLTGERQARVGELGRRFLELGVFMEDLLHHWAKRAPEQPRPVFLQAPAFPSVLIEAHTAVGKKMSYDETIDYMEHRLTQAHEIIGEIVLRIVQNVGPELGRQLLQQVNFATWGVPIPAKRLAIEGLPSLERRHALPSLARDVERGLGPVARHTEAQRAREVLAGMAEN